MDTLEVVAVEVPGEDYGAEKYREILLDILQDLGLYKSIGRIYIYSDIKRPYFAIYGLFRGSLPPLKVRDMGDVTQVDGGYQIQVEEEQHMDDLLKVLWAKYGREGVDQPDRDILIVATESSPEDLVVTDIEVEFRQDLVDALGRITPEGFRNRRNEMNEEGFFFLASEETIVPKLIDEAKEQIRRMADA